MTSPACLAPRQWARRLAALVGGACALTGAGTAWAGDPIMALSDVHPGMSCTGYSVVSGTDIASFAVSVQSVIQAQSGTGPQILVRVSGPAVDATGIGPGFSGSPIYCPDGQGVARNIGAIAESVGDYGNKLALATPIQAILGEPVPAPPGTRRAPAMTRGARPLAGPLTVSGVSPPVAAVYQRVAARAGRVLYAAPSAAGAITTSFPPQTLRPGAAMAAGLTSGDLGLGAIGTVAYTDAARVWGFGHPLDGAGRRALLLQDAYVYTVINNPLGISAGATTYKLAAPGHDVGTLTGDGINAVTGVLGALPPRFPLHILARDRTLDPAHTGQPLHPTQRLNVDVADETGVGLPTGSSALSAAAPIAVTQAAYELLDGAPARESGSMCVAISVRGRARPLGFCNTYVIADAAGLLAAVTGSSPSTDASATPAAGVLMATDLGQAVSDIDSYSFAPPHITSVKVDVNLHVGQDQAYLMGARPLGVARRGGLARLRVRLRRVGGAPVTRMITVRVPRRLRRGPATITLSGTAADGPNSLPGGLGATIDLSGGGGPVGRDPGDPGPRSLRSLAAEIASLHRFDGVSAAFGFLSRSPRRSGKARRRRAGAHRPTTHPADRPSGRPAGAATTSGVAPSSASAAGLGPHVYRDPHLRISGTITVAVTVR